MPYAVRDNPERQRFELDLDGKTAFVAYRRSGGVITLLHAEVPPEFEGHGIGSELARQTLETIRAQGLKVIVVCSFIRYFMRNHPGFDDLLT